MAAQFAADVADGFEQLRRRLKAFQRIEAHHGLHQTNHRMGTFHFLRRHRPDVREPLALHALARILAHFQGGTPRQKLIGHAAQKENIAARVAAGYIGGFFQAGVIDGAVDIAVLGVTVLLGHDAGQAEIDQFGHALAGDQHIGEFHVAMGQALGQGVMQAGRDILEDPQRLGGIEFFADRQKIAEVAAFDKFHHDEILARRRVAIDGDDLDDIGVPQGHAHAALTLEQFDIVLCSRSICGAKP